MKRIVSFVLVLVLLVSNFGYAAVMPVAAAVTTDEIKAAVTEAYEDLLAITSPGEGGASDGAMQLLNHAISGGGSDLIMDETDNYTGMILRSNMYREGFIEGLTKAFDRLVHNYDQKMLVGVNYQYYDHKMSYSASSYKQFGEMLDVDENVDNPVQSGLNANTLEGLKSVKEWGGTENSCDDAMILVNGTCSNRFTIEKVETAGGSAKYQVSLVFWDNFDFGSGNYTGDDTELATALTWFGKLLAMGAFIKTFHFEVHLEFDITFDNECPHQTQSYRWEDNGTDLIAVTGDGLAVSTAERIDSVSSTTGEPLNPYYKLKTGIHLYHNKPWVVEFRGKSNNLYLGPGTTYAHGTPYLLKTSATYVGGVSFKYAGISETTGKEAVLTGRHQYGIDFVEAGFLNYRVHTYRLENRISSDGSNMVYLIVDGEDLGPMNNYYINKKGVNDLQPEKVDWFNGKDIEVNYINNSSFRYNPNAPLEYLQIWENGEGNAAHSYYYTENVAPTCTGRGYTAHICSQCGDTWNDNFVDARGHSYGAWGEKDEQLHSRRCSVCGGEEVDAHAFSNGICSVCGYVSAVSIQGSWTTDLTMSAADLGVSATDSVLRATLTFAEDGTASTSWEAIDLTALRVFFHDMFVNAYYAMAYGAGITDFQQIEQFCMDTTGLSVSAYMDTIVTDEAMKAAFTPAASSGTYSYNADRTAIFTDMDFMGVTSDPAIENSFVAADSTLYLNAASWGKPEFTFVCTVK